MCIYIYSRRKFRKPNFRQYGQMEKKRWEESQRREEQKREDQRREKVRRKKMQVREKVAKSRNTVFFQWFVAPEDWKVGSLKRRVRSHLHMRDEKLHAVVARSRSRSQNVQNTSRSEHFWKLWCRKSARSCGAKHMSKSIQVKSAKNWRVRSTFGRSDVVSCGGRKGLCTLSKVSKTWRFSSSLNYKHHYTTLQSTPLHYNYNYNYTTLHYTTLITLHYTTPPLLVTTLHYTTLHLELQLHYTTRCTTLRQPWHKQHSAFLKMFVSLWRHIDFDTFVVKIWVLKFPTTTFFWRIICLTLSLLSSMTSCDKSGSVYER